MRAKKYKLLFVSQSSLHGIQSHKYFYTLGVIGMAFKTLHSLALISSSSILLQEPATSSTRLYTLQPELGLQVYFVH